MNIDDFDATQNGGFADASIEDVLKVANEAPAPAADEPVVETPPPAPVTEPPVTEPPKTETPPAPPVEPEKPVQSKEDNAKFAEQRRQEQVKLQVQQELDRMRNELPEFKTAKLLSEMYGVPVDQLYANLEQARIQKEAETRQIPVEAVQEIHTAKREAETARQEAETLKTETNIAQFQQWNDRIDAEAKALVNEYPMLSTEDFDAAKQYMVGTLRNPNIPLDQAVYALHGAKILEGRREAIKNEILAEMAGRNAAPIPPSGSKSSNPTQTLTDAERYIAKALGVTEEEYLANK